ncbi:MAG: GNAT family N-acetyltransferase [Bacteroidales bacterium]|nr:GNAT family N-acetyltransferase [Bacteroidales bacterium]
MFWFHGIKIWFSFSDLYFCFVKIRNFNIKDYNKIIRLWETCELPYKPKGRDSKEKMQEELKKGIAVFLVAEEKGNLIGSVLATHDGRKGWINRLSVLPEYRKQGIGAMLVKEAEKRLDEIGIEIIACLIEDGNDTSLQVFSKLGYLEFPGMHYLTKRKYPDV